MNAKNGGGGGGGGELQVTHFCMFAVSPVRCLGFYCVINNPECVVCLITDNIYFLFISLLYHQGTPTDWCMENVAKLLKLCGETVCFEVLGNKAINGRIHELSYLGYYLGQVKILVLKCYYKLRVTNSKATNLVKDVLKSSNI